MILALVTVFMGSMLAYREKILKKRLAYSTVSQISYIMFGLSLLNDFGVAGGLLHVVYHACVKVVLFLFAGVVIHQTGKTKAADLDGLGKRMPITYVCYTLVSITLVGIPPTSAFLSKMYLCLGALQTNNRVIYYGGIAVLLISALLTAGYLLTITVKGFYYEGEEDEKTSLEPSGWMLVPMILLTILAVGLGVFSKPLMNFIIPIATELI
jgi:multicomponent Na+:H+ antiporter subunit D